MALCEQTDPILQALSQIYDAEHCLLNRAGTYNLDLMPADIMYFTWNPDLKKMHVDPIRAHQKFIDNVFHQLDKCWTYYCILPEISKKGRLHYHGWMYHCRDKIKWYKFVLPKIKMIGIEKQDPGKKEPLECNYEDEVGDPFYYYKKDLFEYGAEMFGDKYVMSHQHRPVISTVVRRQLAHAQHLVHLQSIMRKLEREDACDDEKQEVIFDFFDSKRNKIRDYDNLMLAQAKKKYKK